MTAPLSAVAGWDLPLLRGAVGTLDVVAGRLPAWRARAEAVGRALESAECWSGPAATEAARAVLDLSGAVTAASASMVDSLVELARLVSAAEEAQQAAAAALSTATAEGLAIDEHGAVLTAPADRTPAAARVEELAAHAAAAAAVVGAAAEAAERALLPAAALDVGPPASPPDLVDRLWAVPLEVPAGLGPADAARWWASLSAPEQKEVLGAHPEAVGGLDGVPAWARDRANRMLLADALVRTAGPGAGTASTVTAEIARQEAAGRRVQLWMLDLDENLAAVAVGDLDTADAVAVLVPGIGTTPEDDLAARLGDAAAVVDRAQAAAPGLAVAAMAWIGYRTPHGPLATVRRDDARHGGLALASALDGLAAARTALAAAAPRTTVLAHSYGTVVADEAARTDGALAADAVVLLGSPGGAGSAAALEAPEVYDAFSVLDPVSWVHWFGPDPWSAEFGATELPTEADMLHWEYYDPTRPTLDAIGQVVAGRTTG